MNMAAMNAAVMNAAAWQVQKASATMPIDINLG